jgi:hypothetical protein
MELTTVVMKYVKIPMLVQQTLTVMAVLVIRLSQAGVVDMTTTTLIPWLCAVHVAVVKPVAVTTAVTTVAMMAVKYVKTPMLALQTLTVMAVPVILLGLAGVVDMMTTTLIPWLCAVHVVVEMVEMVSLIHL